jgi:cellulose biosynthesis protein BcsQ
VTLPIQTVQKPFSAEMRLPLTSGTISGTEIYQETTAPLKNLAQFSNFGRWTGLDVVLSSSHGLRSKDLEARHRRIPGVSVSGVASGIGTSSVMASLARLGARRGEQVILLDVSTDSLMPLFFGGRNSTVPVASFVFSGDARSGSVHTCRREEGDLREPAESSVTRWLDSMAGESDQILVDGGTNRDCRLMHERIGTFLQLLVLIPDTRCLAALKRIEDAYADSRSGDEASPLLLLNQFDASDPLHTEIRARLLNRFPNRLIPIQIRRDRQIPAALAEGMTVVDYAPESNSVEDMVRLDQWLRAQYAEESLLDVSQKVQVCESR